MVRVTNPNKPNFWIVIDEPKKAAYSAGDRIRGRVCFASSTDHDVGKVTVTFRGRSKTKLYRRDGYGNRMTFRGRANLFSESEVLYYGQYTHKAPNFEWPFEFQFPDKAKKTTDGDSWTNNHASFPRSDQFDDVLLPSTMFTKGHVLRVVHNFDCFVEYKLEATMINPATDKTVLETGIEIPFVQLSPAEPVSPSSTGGPSTHSSEVRSLKLDPQKDGRALSIIKEKAKSAFGSSVLPKNLEVILEAPAAVRLGDASILTIKLNHLDHPRPSDPPVSLQSVEAALVASTRVRSRKNLFRGMENSSEDEVSCDVGIRANPASWSGPFEKEAYYVKHLELDHFHTLGVIPSFATYNICRKYTLRTRYVLECGGKQVKFQRQDPIEIFPVQMQNAEEVVHFVSKQVPASIADSSSELGDSNFGDSAEDLPLYEDTGDDAPPPVAAETASSTEKPGLLRQL